MITAVSLIQAALVRDPKTVLVIQPWYTGDQTKTISDTQKTQSAIFVSLRRWYANYNQWQNDKNGPKAEKRNLIHLDTCCAFNLASYFRPLRGLITHKSPWLRTKITQETKVLCIGHFLYIFKRFSSSKSRHTLHWTSQHFPIKSTLVTLKIYTNILCSHSMSYLCDSYVT